VWGGGGVGGGGGQRVTKFLHTHFTQFKSTLDNRELSTVSKDFIMVVC